MLREKSRISPIISHISPAISDQVRREKSRWEKTIGGVVFTGRQEVMARAKAIIEDGTLTLTLTLTLAQALTLALALTLTLTKAIIEEGKAATPEGAISYPNPNS